MFVVCAALSARCCSFVGVRCVLLLCADCRVLRVVCCVLCLVCVVRRVLCVVWCSSVGVCCKRFVICWLLCGLG